jgi:aspartyl protease family protein
MLTRQTGTTMLRTTILLGICIGAFASVPLLYQSSHDAVHGVSASVRPANAGELPSGDAKPVATAAPPSVGGRKVEISADERGHYVGDFKLNGRKVVALIDTGATAVALNLSTAQRLGLGVRSSDMSNSVTTANGRARAATVMVDRVEIGRIAVENVPAVVLEDQALDTILIGMTFLNRLKKFEVERGALLLAQ